MIKARRLKQYLQNMKPGENMLKTLDIDYFLKELSIESSQILRNLNKYGLNAPLTPDLSINLIFQTANIAFRIPLQEKLFILETLWGAFMAFTNLSFDDFVFILFAILLETPICFFSTNLCLLTSTM